MDAKTLQAVKDSIAHHERLLAGVPGEHYGTHQCALCQLYNNPDTDPDVRCFGCPVSKATGHARCIGTPYNEAQREFLRNEDDQKWRTAQQAEIDFLKSLLPKDEPK